MKQLFAQYGSAMAEAHKALVALNDKQEQEIAAVKEEYKELLVDYSRSQKKNERIIKGFEAKLDAGLKGQEMHAAHSIAMLDIGRINTAFSTKWGDGFEVCEKKIAAIKKKYGRMYHETMKEAGFNPDALTD